MLPTCAALLAALAAAGEGAGAPVVLPEEVVVTGARSPRPTSALPVAVDVIGKGAIAASAASTPDALLRAVPSFQTFRRSTSLAADPSSQGLSLRGIGPSAVSRALLLDDGVPVNDPFGGWVAWRALPRLGLERIEVAPGGASALYGSFALGGVVALVHRPVAPGTEVLAEASGGAAGTAAAALRVAHREGGLGAALELDGLRTDGYPVVAPGARGPVDGRAGADHATGALRLRWEASPALTLTAGLTAFTEAQDGGTRFTRSDLGMVGGRAGLGWRGGAGTLDVVVYGAVRRFEQERARFAEGRASEARAALQEVPSRDLGGSVVAALAPRGRHRLTLGADLRRVSGETDERLFPAAPAPDGTVGRGAEGAQLLGGLFAEESWAVAPGVELAGALRLDGWWNGAAVRTRRTEGGGRAVERLEGRGALQLSPRLAALWRPAPALALRASAYRAFRAPTLNELYRTFQVGTVVTAPEPGLRAETLVGGEAGPELQAGPARARVTAFWNRLDAPVGVVTLAEPLPDGATRRRANLGAVRVRGLEAWLQGQGPGGLSGSLGWTFVDTRVLSAPGARELEGKRLPHDPPHRVSAEVALSRPALLDGSVAVRWLSRAWEDDRNTLPMAGYAVVDVAASRRITGRVEVFVAAENVLDRTYLVGRAGVDTVGAPRLVRAGLRVRSAARQPAPLRGSERAGRPPRGDIE